MPEPCLVIGIGNSSRGDDGLGWTWADRLAALPQPGCDLEYRYQLSVEDAACIARYTAVLFVDATEAVLPGGYRLRVCLPEPMSGCYSHQLAPGAVLDLCRTVFGRMPAAWVLEIQGRRWALGDDLGPEAADNLARAWAAWGEAGLGWLAQPAGVLDGDGRAFGQHH
ncbi:MAG: hypothetical protein OHK0039_19340 [Bacteroidia bacterium]